MEKTKDQSVMVRLTEDLGLVIPFEGKKSCLIFNRHTKEREVISDERAIALMTGIQSNTPSK